MISHTSHFIEFDVVDQLIVLWHCLIAAGCGAIIGAEREVSGKHAGIRTHMLVAAASAAAVGIGAILAADGAGDSTRTMHAVITGVGFIGAGTIIHSKQQGITGITTAATVLYVAVVGIAAGFGASILAVGATLIGVGTLRTVKTVTAKAEQAPKQPQP